MTGALVRLAVAGLIAFGTSGCGALQQGCTAAGCTSGISVDLAADSARFAGATARLCVHDRCNSRELSTATGFVAWVLLGPDNTAPDPAFPTDAPLPVHLVVTRDGQTLVDRTDQVTLAPDQPNGERCEPTCWRADLLLSGDELTTRGPDPR